MADRLRRVECAAILAAAALDAESLALYQDVNPSDRPEDAPRVILGGNFGMPCA